MARTERLRTFVLHLDKGTLPDALVSLLRDEVVLGGSVRGAGLVEDAELATVSSTGAPTTRRIPGISQVVCLEGSIGAEGGDVGCSLRVVLSGSPSGTASVGELLSARVRSLECFVTAIDDVPMFVHRLGEGISVVGLSAPSAQAAAARVPPAAAAPFVAAPAAAGSSSGAAPMMPPEAPTEPALPDDTPSSPALVAATGSAPTLPEPSAERPRSGMVVPTGNASMPARPARKQSDDEDELTPEAGDLADHFAFGRSEIVKSDGERLLLRSREGRIKEIALEMLKVTLLPEEGGKRVFRLSRKL